MQSIITFGKLEVNRKIIGVFIDSNLKSSESTHSMTSRDCAMCLNTIGIDEFVMFQCKHSACIHCTGKLLVCVCNLKMEHEENLDEQIKTAECPLCRSQIRAIYTPSYKVGKALVSWML